MHPLMPYHWSQEIPPYWDADKERIISEVGRERVALEPLELGDLLSGDWFRVEDGDQVVGYAWMDTTWGDAEIMLAVDPAAQGKGVGPTIIERLDAEAARRGVNYLYNSIPESHPDPDRIRTWLERQGFAGSQDSRLLRRRVADDAA